MKRHKINGKEAENGFEYQGRWLIPDSLHKAPVLRIKKGFYNSRTKNETCKPKRYDDNYISSVSPTRRNQRTRLCPFMINNGCPQKKCLEAIFSIIETTYNGNFFVTNIMEKVLSLSKRWNN